MENSELLKELGSAFGVEIAPTLTDLEALLLSRSLTLSLVSSFDGYVLLNYNLIEVYESSSLMDIYSYALSCGVF